MYEEEIALLKAENAARREQVTVLAERVRELASARERSSDPAQGQRAAERLIRRLEQFRRVATRYEQLAVSYLAVVTIAAVLMWL